MTTIASDFGKEIEMLEAAMKPAQELKFCRDCKHLLGRRDQPENVDKWKCHAPQNIDKQYKDYVTGELVTVIKYWPIICIRTGITPMGTDIRKVDPSTDICGPEGKWYEEYIHPSISVTNLTAEETNVESFNTGDILAARKAADERLAKLRAKKAAPARISTNDLENL